MYPYLTERMLHQSAALAPLGEIAVQHRPARSAEEAEMRAQVRAGRLDGAAVNAVLATAGHRLPRRREAVAGLTAREVEVLVLYAKAGAANRAAVVLFAVHHGLLPDDRKAPSR
jgi:hypothetical protein